MGRPNAKAGGDGSGDNPDCALSTSGCACAIEQINRCETCEQADDRGDSDKPPVMLDRKTS
jgi:hypothetical protein